jgi:hypothetical protein
MVVPAREVDAAVFVVPMPPALEAPTMRVAMGMPVVAGGGGTRRRIAFSR